MKAAAVFYNENKVKIIDIDEPQITTSDQVKIKILEVGICGTDRDICSFKYGAAPKNSDYLIIGHEALGEIVEAGARVHDLRIGDIATITVRRKCFNGRCAPCSSLNADYCVTGDFAEHGIKNLHGFMTEYVVQDRQNVVLIPKNLKDFGVFTEPLSIVIKAIKRAIVTRQNFLPEHAQNALIIGAGTIGILGAMYLVSNGINTFVYSRGQKDGIKGDIIRKIGAHYFTASEYSLKELSNKIAGIDIIFEAAGNGTLVPDLVNILGRNGVLSLTGIAGEEQFANTEFSEFINNLVLKNQVIIGSVNASYQDFEDAVRFLGIFSKKWKAELKRMITYHHFLHNNQNILNSVFKIGNIKNVIIF